MNEIAQSNWEKFAADKFEEPMQGHLLRYPIDVGQDGTVSNLPLLFSFWSCCWQDSNERFLAMEIF